MGHDKRTANDNDAFEVQLLCSFAPRQVDEERLRVVPGETVLQILARSTLLRHHFKHQSDSLDEAAASKEDSSQALIRLCTTGYWCVGIWGRAVALSQTVNKADRIEIYRALKVDPKEARRLRYKNHLKKFPRRKAGPNRSPKGERISAPRTKR